MAVILEHVLMGLLYLPFLVTPFILLIGYALKEARAQQPRAYASAPKQAGTVLQFKPRGRHQAVNAA